MTETKRTDGTTVKSGPVSGPLDLLQLLGVAPGGPHEWLGRVETGTRDRLFGGQVVAQALVAAAADVDDAEFAPRSVHGHFLRAGFPDRTVRYQVTALTDGRSFATRQVLAVQSGPGVQDRIIAVVVATFHRPEISTEHQAAMPLTTAPEDLESDGAEPAGTNPRIRLPFELRTVQQIMDSRDAAAQIRVWVRSRQALNGSPVLNAAALVWIADFSLPWATDAPHAHEPGARTGASLDHTLWFHRPVVVSEWHLLDQVSPIYTGARGLAVGHFFDRGGSMIATAVQESMIRRDQTWLTVG